MPGRGTAPTLTCHSQGAPYIGIACDTKGCGRAQSRGERGGTWPRQQETRHGYGRVRGRDFTIGCHEIRVKASASTVDEAVVIIILLLHNHFPKHDKHHHLHGHLLRRCQYVPLTTRLPDKVVSPVTARVVPTARELDREVAPGGKHSNQHTV